MAPGAYRYAVGGAQGYAAATMVGRDRELARVTRLLDDALAGRGCLVLCTGEAGIGKTRLAEELAASAVARSVPVAWARATDRDSSPPYDLWRLALDEPAVRGGADDVVRQDLWSDVFGDAGRPALADRVRAVHSETGGNPFLVRELTRMLAEQRGNGRGEPGFVPGRVLEMTAYRLSQVSDAARALLRAAEVAADALAFEEAVRLYRRALSVGEDEIGEADRARLELGLAATLYRSGDLVAWQETAIQVGRQTERRRDRLLLARTALVMDASGEISWATEICRICQQALAGDELPDDLPPGSRPATPRPWYTAVSTSGRVRSAGTR